MPRNWLGFEAFAMLPYDDPAWFEEMLETQCRAAERQLRYFGERGVPLDCIHFWEDISFENYLTCLRLRHEILGLGRAGLDCAVVCR